MTPVALLVLYVLYLPIGWVVSELAWHVETNNIILAPVGAETSIEKLVKDISKIAYDEKLCGYGLIYDPDELKTWEILSYNFENANADDKVLSLDLSRFMFKNDPNEEDRGEIKALVRTFFYIKSHKLPINISIIMLTYIRIRAGEAILYITIEELEELYRQVYVEGLPANEQANLLADIIVEKSGYYRNGSEFWINKPKE